MGVTLIEIRLFFLYVSSYCSYENEIPGRFNAEIDLDTVLNVHVDFTQSESSI